MPSGTPAEGHDEAARLYLALGRLTRALRHDVPQALVGYGALGTLATLVRCGPRRLGDLAQSEAVSAPSMTHIVASLEALGMVWRTPDPADGRATLVEATPQGEELVRSGTSERMRALRARIERIDDDDRAALRAVLPVLERLAGLEADPDDS